MQKIHALHEVEIDLDLLNTLYSVPGSQKVVTFEYRRHHVSGYLVQSATLV